MPGFNPEQINIHDLTIEEPEKGTDLAFDPERDLTREDWAKMEEQLDTFYHTENYSDFCKLFGDMKAVDSTNSFLANYQISEKFKQDNLKNWTGRSAGFWVDFAEIAVALKAAPEKFGQENNIDEKDWKAMFDILKYYCKNRGSEFGLAITELAACMKILDKRKDDKINEIISWEYLQDNLEEFKRNGQWAEFSEMAKNIKIVKPTMDLGLDKEVWESLREELKRSSADDLMGWQRLAKEAVALKILAAEKVDVTDKGLEITMRGEKKGLDNEVPPVPETKNF